MAALITQTTYGSYIHTKACYLCHREAPNPLIASSTCAYCGKDTVVYGIGRLVTVVTKPKSFFRRGFIKPVVTSDFVLQYSNNIDWQRHVGLPVQDYSTSKGPINNPHLITPAHIRG
jgi:hypothetical protein